MMGINSYFQISLAEKYCKYVVYNVIIFKWGIITMKKCIFVLSLLFIMLLSEDLQAALLDPLYLKGQNVSHSDGSEFFMDILEEDQSRVTWSHIEMDPPFFGISGEIESPSRVYPGTPSITLRIRSGERIVTRILRLKWFALTVFATRDIDRGETLSPGDLDLRISSYRRSSGSIFSDLSSIRNFRAKRKISAQDAISSRDVEKPMLIERRDRLTILSRSGAVEAELEGVALESGAKGSRIRVRIPLYRKDLEAIVIGKGLVLVQN